MANNNYQTVTDRIIAMLEQGVRPWAKSWKPGEPVNLINLARPLSGATGKAYTGINVINLWVAAQQRGFRSRYWFTFKGAKDVGANVRKGAKAELCFFVGKHTVTDQPADGADPTERTISFMRAYPIFNADEIEGLPAEFYADAEAAPVVDGRMATVDAFMAALDCTVAHGGDRAFYSPAFDAIRMPHIAQFDKPESYYATLLHETIHWTSHENRCDRELGKRFGDDAYAAEELVAELGAAFLCADLGVSADPREDHASYLAEWLKVLKADNRAIFRAAALAEKAATWLHDQQPTPEVIDLDAQFGSFLGE